MNPGENVKRHPNDEFLGGNQFVSLYRMPDFYGYTYTVNPRCSNECVAVLPYRYKDNTGLNIEYLGRYEICPAHSDVTELCSITGGCDKPGKTPVEIAVMETLEEAGYIVSVEDMQYLGTVKPSKASAVTNHLYAVCVNDRVRVEAPGDGTEGEIGAYCDWVSEYDATMSKDPMLSTMIHRLHMNLFARA